MRRLVLALAGVAALAQAAAQSDEPYEKPPINYSTTAPRDAVTRLQARVAAGDLTWRGNSREILLRLLQELKIPVESQLLVFSKTSFQRRSISPRQPRALYFSDTAYVGWVPGGLIEVTTIDPQLGPVFYSFDPNAAAPGFVRDEHCLECHGGVFVRGIPAVFARSIFTEASGEPLFRFGSELVDYRTPFTNRWAGWYVTGPHGRVLHRGNVLAEIKDDKLAVDLKRGANRTNLAEFCETKPYPVAGSDIVALLVFEHQIAMQNALTRAAMNCRRMLSYQRNLQLELKEPVTEELKYESVKHVFEDATRDVTDVLLFRHEAELPDGLGGDAAFQTAFRQGAPQAGGSGSLKDFHLKGHLFRNRCSYLIYSDSFASLPAELKRRVYARLAAALHPTNADPEYGYIPPEERVRISNILEQTHAEFRAALRR